MNNIEEGREQVEIYHNFIFESLLLIFEDILSNPLKDKVDDITIGSYLNLVFDNIANNGFIAALKTIYNIKSSKIIINCYNKWTSDGLTEINQIIEGLNRADVNFGILIYRNINDKELINESCVNAMKNHRKTIIAIDDRDIRNLLDWKEYKNSADFNSFFKNKFKDLNRISNQ